MKRLHGDASTVLRSGSGGMYPPPMARLALGMPAPVDLLWYTIKPLVLVAMIALAARAPRPISTRYRLLIVVGLAWSLAGDILLMLPQDRFVPGLLAFLVAHGCYIIAFARTGGGARDPLVALGIAGYAGAMLTFLWPSLGDLRIPVIVYVAVIATMAWQAIARWRHLRTPDAARAAAGAAMFLASDTALAIERFRGEFPGSFVTVIGTYWVAQYLIARSVQLDER
jgi:uncharacterized membrane protein YhhN